MLKSNLSQRGSAAAAGVAELAKLSDIWGNIYDPVSNPDGIVFLGLADNALLRAEVLDYFNSKPINLVGPELTYSAQICAQQSLLNALAHLYNSVPDGLDHSTFASRKPLLKVEPTHIKVGLGASGVLDSLFYAIADDGDAVLVSSPWYNGFDHDLTARAALEIVHVKLPAVVTTTGASDSFDKPGQPCFEEDLVAHYEEAIAHAIEQGKTVKALLVCNPHNPTGAIMSRKALVDLCKFAGKYKLHLVSDEIYSRSVFESDIVKQPNEFYSVLSIDTLAEAGLDPSFVHVVTAASKDFSINGFRLGVLISQGNQELHLAALSNSILNQSSSPAGALWRDWIRDEHFLTWYLTENRRRLRDSFHYVARFLAHHKIPFAPSNAGHFLLVDLSKYLGSNTHEAEAELLKGLVGAKVFIAPGAQYHMPQPGFFRLTFSQPPLILREGLARLEAFLELPAWVRDQPLPSWSGPPAELLRKSSQLRDSFRDQDLAAFAGKLTIDPAA